MYLFTLLEIKKKSLQDFELVLSVTAVLGHVKLFQGPTSPPWKCFTWPKNHGF